MILARGEIRGGDLQEWIALMDRGGPLLQGKPDVLYSRILEVIDKSTTSNYLQGGRPHWEPRKYVYPWPILRKTQNMMRKTLSYIRGKWVKVGNTHELRIFSAFYGIFHQYGTKRLPERPFVAIHEEESQEIHRIITTALLGI